MPALLPDGTQSRLSVSGVLVSRAAEARASARSAIGGEVIGAEQERAGPDPGRPRVPVVEKAGLRRRPMSGSGGPGAGQWAGGGPVISPANYVALAAILFVIGGVGVLVRRNALVVFMCVELMLNAINLAFVAFARLHGDLTGQVIAFFVMVVAAAEVVVGLAII